MDSTSSHILLWRALWKSILRGWITNGRFGDSILVSNALKRKVFDTSRTEKCTEKNVSVFCTRRIRQDASRAGGAPMQHLRLLLITQ